VSMKPINKAQRWIDRGYGVAVYRNVDLSSPNVGHVVLLRVGKDSSYRKAPMRFPDTRKVIGWRYYLQTVTRSKKNLERYL